MEKPNKYHAWSCQNVCDALTFLLDNIFIQFGTKLYRQVVGIPMGTNCAPLVADLFLFCYERDFMMSLSDDKQADVIEALPLHPIIWRIFLTLTMFILKIWLFKYTLQSSNLIKPIPLILKLHFKTCICLFLMIQFLPKFMMNVTTLILKLSFSHFKMAMFFALHPMESISLNPYVLLEHLAILLTSTLAINC